MSYEDLVKLLNSDEESLWLQLANDTVLGVGSLDPDERRRLGRAWFASHLSQIRSLVCGSVQVDALNDPDNVDTLTVAAAVADALAMHFSAPALYSLTALCMRYGLTRLCTDEQ